MLIDLLDTEAGLRRSTRSQSRQKDSGVAIAHWPLERPIVGLESQGLPAQDPERGPLPNAFRP